jgi:ABC-type multidrug transport system permease subunit
MVPEAWAVPIVLAVLFGLLVVADGIVLASGAYQVFTGRPSLVVRIVASIRMRLPATPADCVLLGAAQVLQSVGLFVGMSPILLPLAANTSDLWGGHQLPALSRWPALAIAYFAYVLAAFIIAIVCAAVSFALSLRVKYVIDDGSIKVAGRA